MHHPTRRTIILGAASTLVTGAALATAPRADAATLVVDGILGPKTMYRAQAITGAGSWAGTIYAIQIRLRGDGYYGRDGRLISTSSGSIYSNQYGTTPFSHTQYALICAAQGNFANDGRFDYPTSAGVKAWQRVMNTGWLY